jgi:hypothetical protein
LARLTIDHPGQALGVPSVPASSLGLDGFHMNE